MSMSIKSQKMQSWQVFRVARKYLGVEIVAQIFRKEKRSAYSWSQDPAFTEHRCRNPLDLLHALFEKMDAVGLGYVVRDAILYLESAVDSEIEAGEIKEPLSTVELEILADYSSLGKMQSAIEASASLSDVIALKDEALAEIERTVVLYSKNF